MSDWDYLLFTNLDIDETTTSWTVIKIDPSKYCKTGSHITYSRLPKFNIMALVGTKYDIITYMDGYLSPIDDANLWDTIISKLDDNDIIVEPHPSSINPFDECKFIIKCKKDTITRMNLMTQYLMDNGINSTMDVPVYQNTYFTYSTKKDIIIKTFEDIWNFLLSNDITHRDQPIHSYFFYKNNIKPTFYKNITQKKLFNNTGKMGKHIYI